MEGIIVKGIAGFYYVRCETSLYECKARGIFRKDRMVPHVGDHVSIEVLEKDKGIITEICPRKNKFVRPPIANVDCFIIVCAAAKPKPNLMIIDQFLVMAEEKRTDVLLCINKADLVTDEELFTLCEIYKDIYPVCCVSGKNGVGITDLKSKMNGKTCALAGPSGVGKSTLLNCLRQDYTMETGAISDKTHRGKHTTRHAELFEMEFGGSVFDTPGFTSFDVLDSDEEELAFLFPEMIPYQGMCKYDNCRHLKEPNCAVTQAVAEGRIKESRYQSYMAMMKAIQEKRRF
ncbi:ribosome small subunit-dependent GTPase A [Sinanaerobacter sp. ZZT-01]|uniref:ribosome small subunit-dependent GTPase A n=1 Tax=Sinanaerobacter sp. ZZT-01 TaxID=3111540 RepID=UPI002D766BB0|nr:ribosome small subunit-dependent GTPase A [Sinanaerobacter sp. ZZT-01]WRR92784.1 ribosome small subunit-dependent GTPase A [Sinanaerobacter sp. ZZT-01]